MILLLSGSNRSLESTISSVRTKLSRVDANLIVVCRESAAAERRDLDLLPGGVLLPMRADASEREAINAAMQHAGGDIVVICRGDTPDPDWVESLSLRVRPRAEAPARIPVTDERLQPLPKAVEGRKADRRERVVER